MPSLTWTDRPVRVLVVEDQRPVREAVSELFRLVHYEVLEADTLGRAVDLVDHADLVVLDLHLPDGNGLELLELVAEFEDPPAVVVVTGHATLDYAIRALHAGAHSFLLKPAQPDDLVMLAGRALEDRRRRRELLAWRDMVHALPSVVLAVDEAGDVAWCNAVAAAALGLPAEEIAGRPAAEFLAAAPTRPSGEGGDEEYRFFRPDGTAGFVEGRWVEVRGARALRLFVGRDLTHERRLARRLHASEVQAELNALVAGLVGELADPVTWLGANLDLLAGMLEEAESDRAEARELVAEARNGVDRVREQVRAIQAVVRDATDERMRLVDLREVVAPLVHAAGRDIDAGARVELVDPPGEDLRLLAQESRLASMTHALLRWSLERTPAGGIVQVELRREGDTVGLELRDGGPTLAGMGDEDGVLSPIDAASGGLSLASAHGVVAAHGGHMRLLPPLNWGMRLRVELPAAAT